MSILRYELRSLRQNPLRAVLAIAAVLLTVTLMVGIGAVMDAAQEENIRLFAKNVDYDLTVKLEGDPFNTSYFELAEVEAALQIAGITEYHPAIETQVLVTTNGSQDRPHLVTHFGIDPGYKAGTIESEEGILVPGPGQVVISPFTAASLGVDLGDSFTVLYVPDTSIFTANLSAFLSGNLSLEEILAQVNASLLQEEFEVVGILDVVGRWPAGIRSWIQTDLATSQEMYEREGQASTIYALMDRGLYDDQDIRHPVDRVVDVGEKIARTLGPGFDVRTPRASVILVGLQQNQFFPVITYLFTIVLPGISGVLISSIISLAVEERRKDLAMMRLLGARRTVGIGMVLAELGVFLAVGIPLGLLTGWFLPDFILGLTGLFSGVSVTPAWPTVGLQLAILIVMTLLFVLGPIRAAFASHPLEAVLDIRDTGKHHYRERRGIDPRLVVAGFALFGFLVLSGAFFSYFITNFDPAQFCFSMVFVLLTGLISLSVGLLGFVPRIELFMLALVKPFTRRVHTLAKSGIERNLRRNVSTNLIFGITAALLILFTSLFASIEGSYASNARFFVGSDLRVMQIGDDLPEGFAELVVADPGVAERAFVTSGWWLEAGDPLNNHHVWIRSVGISPDFLVASYSDRIGYAAGSESAWDLLDDGAIISEALALHLNLKLGDDLAIRGEDGNKTFLPITAILTHLPGLVEYVFENRQFAGGSGVFVSYARWQELTGQDLAFDSAFLKLHDDADPATVTDRIYGEFGYIEGLFIFDTQGDIDAAQGALAKLQVVFQVVSYSLLLIGIFSLLTNLYASIRERSFEIGVLKAVGLRNAGILRMFLLESVVIALSSMVMGVLAGIAVAYLVLAGFNSLIPTRIDFVIPWDILGILTVVTLVFSILGAWLPGRIAARRSTIRLLQKQW